jgi:dTDP-glucose 4,6-dehydratase
MQSRKLLEQMVNKRVAILGSNSFSGSNLVNYLLQRSYFVLGISRQTQIQKPFLPYSVNENFHFLKLDINKNFTEIAKACAEFEITHFINFSAQSMVAESWEYPWHWYSTNLVSLSKLVSELNSFVKIEKFIQFSTPEVYGSTDDWISESFEFNPTTPYAISRAAGDFHLRALNQSKDFPVIFTRAANVFGEHQQSYRLIPRALISGLTGKKIPLHGGGFSERSFIHIDDVSGAIEKIFNHGEIGNSYHISTNRIERIKDIIQICANSLNLDFDELCDDSKERVGKDKAYKLNSSKIRSELGWEDKISLEIGIERTLNWAKKNLDDILLRPLNYIHVE